MNNWRNWDKPVPLVIGRAWNALWQIRALGMAGIPVVHGWTSWNDPAMFSRYAHHVKLPDFQTAPVHTVGVINDIARKTRAGLLVFDYWPGWGDFLKVYQDRLEISLDLPRAIDICLDKGRMHQVAVAEGIPTPLTHSVPSLRTISHKRFPYQPCILKPQKQTLFPKMARKLMGGRAAKVFANRTSLRLFVSHLLDKGIDFPAIVQEYIPGGAENLFSVTSFSNKEGVFVIASPIQKIRQYAADAGTIVVGRLKTHKDAFGFAKRLLDSIGYNGLANTEFKLDERDGKIKFMETNPRLGKSHGSALALGINLPLMKYKEAIGENLVVPNVETQTGSVWIDLLYDLKNCFWSHREMYPISLMEYLDSIRGKKIPAVWLKEDPLPSLVHAWNVLCN